MSKEMKEIRKGLPIGDITAGFKQSGQWSISSHEHWFTL